MGFSALILKYAQMEAGDTMLRVRMKHNQRGISSLSSILMHTHIGTEEYYGIFFSSKLSSPLTLATQQRLHLFLKLTQHFRMKRLPQGPLVKQSESSCFSEGYFGRDWEKRINFIWVKKIVVFSQGHNPIAS